MRLIGDAAIMSLLGIRVQFLNDANSIFDYLGIGSRDILSVRFDNLPDAHVF
jgi:hypothetical protein